MAQFMQQFKDLKKLGVYCSRELQWLFNVIFKPFKRFALSSQPFHTCQSLGTLIIIIKEGRSYCALSLPKVQAQGASQK